jgi:hypothetical protein
MRDFPSSVHWSCVIPLCGISGIHSLAIDVRANSSVRNQVTHDRVNRSLGVVSLELEKHCDSQSTTNGLKSSRFLKKFNFSSSEIILKRANLDKTPNFLNRPLDFLKRFHGLHSVFHISWTWPYQKHTEGCNSHHDMRDG